jgi:anti-sigma regulatory factor (Ser/Thr protein kinase)
VTFDRAVRPHVGEHAVRFYRSDSILVEMVVDYVGSALRNGDIGVLIVTSSHREAIERGLLDDGLDTGQAIADGSLILWDAGATLDEFTADGVPDPARFDAVVGAVVRTAAASGRSVRAYGEMVAVLWEAGNVAGSLRLEELWNDLRDQVSFSLLCGYDTHLVEAADEAAAFSEVCDAHSHVVAGAPVACGADATRRFVGTAHGPRLARRFVLELLGGWGCLDLADDALLVTSELATNAVRYSGSDFTVSLSRRDDGVTVVVGDSSPAAPRPRIFAEWETGGRGLHLVDESAQQWGHRAVDDGRLVWAHIGRVGGVAD